MKPIIYLITISLFLNACKSTTNTIVKATYIDSLIGQYKAPPVYEANKNELKFWKNRIDPKNPGIVAELKYASSLAMQFNLTGDINLIKQADSILQNINKVYNNKEAAPFLALVRHAILQHQFLVADSLLQKAKEIGIKPYESLSISFDVDFELGRNYSAENELKKIIGCNDYGYYFRLSKLAHYEGDVDTAIAAMQKAADLADNNIYLKQAALSNLADLYLHNGQLQKAYSLYQESIQLSSSDLHSLMGIGWIALVHDKNIPQAKKIFQFVQTKTKSPEPVYKLMFAAEAQGDSSAQAKYAKEFVSIASDTINGNMYNKYLITIYTGILNDPAKAESIAKNELNNRATSQTYAWYAWTLFKNNKTEEAYTIYEKYVSGRPLEGPELYWMGKLMQALKKGYNAQQFFKEADKNKYDLSPAMIKDLEENLKN